MGALIYHADSHSETNDPREASDDARRFLASHEEGA